MSFIRHSVRLQHIGGHLRTLNSLSDVNRSLCSASGTDSSKYDLIVIGGGSGGLACSKEAAKYGKKLLYWISFPHHLKGLSGAWVEPVLMWDVFQRS